MMPTNLLLCTLLLLAPTVSLCQNHECPVRRNFTVSDRGSSSEGCYNQIPGHCKSLQIMLEHASSCANIIVLDNQSLSTGITFQHLSDLLISGAASHPAISVECGNNSGLFFTTSSRISITNLHFVGCSVDVAELIDSETRSTISSFPLFSIAFLGGHEIEIVECTFSNYNSSSLLLIDVNSTSIEGSHFTGADNMPRAVGTKSGGIVLRRSYKSIGNFSYTIKDCNFIANLALPEDAECPHNVSYDEDPHTGYGGAIDIRLSTQNSTTDITVVNSNFTRNRALHGGAISMAFSGSCSTNTVNLIDSMFDSNIACIQGGAVLIFSDIILEHFNESSFGSLRVESTTFVSNGAFLGGGVSMYRCETCGKLHLSARNSVWALNSALTSGYGVAIGGNHTSTERDEVTNLKFHAEASFTDCKFLRNTNNGLYRNINAIGALYITACDVKISGNTRFDSNSGTALLMNGLGRTTFAGNVTFSENFGVNGGAIYVLARSQIRFNSTANVLFANNKAMVLGGAIYSKPMHETYSHPSIPCLFESDYDYNFTVTFEGNLASNTDQAIYVGNPEGCNQELILNDFNYIPDIKNQVQTIADTVVFDTIPETVNGTLKVMLGEEFFLDPTVTDKFGHNSISYGYLALLLADSYEYADSLNFTLKGPISIGADNFTKNNVFYITGPDYTSRLVLEFLYEQISTYQSSSTFIQMEIIPCKIGFKYSPEMQKCECSIDEDNDLICSHESNVTKVCIKKGYWYNQETKNTIPCPTTNCDYSNGKCPSGTEECPNSPGYCNISNADDVCWVGRGGYLCSQCKEGYGFSFGALGCSKASTCGPKNTFLIMLAVFAYWLLIIGILVAILTLNDLSVGSGFMYGLIYYFSVVTLFADVSINNVFLRYLISACVSLTQLDPRILVQFLPICFIKQMDDGLQHLMLRYVTPLFIICIIISIILLSRCQYCRLPKRISLSQNSPIHAICVLILFSYTGLSHTSFQILRPTVIDGSVRVAASPTTSYFDPKNHLPYAFFALIIELLIALPICVLFLFAPCLSKKVNLVKLRLLPILDEFQACYRTKCRWFAGFYFLARQLMYFATLIPQHDLPQINMLLQVLNVAILLVHTIVQPYKQWWLNVVDTILLTDIVVFSLYSTLTAGLPQLSGLNWFIYEATPFVLILIPTGYLVGVFATLFIKRLWHWIKSVRQSRASHGNSTQNPSTSSEVTIRDDGISSSESARDSTLTYSFFKDVGEREPLLMDAVMIETGSLHSMPRQSEGQSCTHSSIELLPSHQ